MRREQFYGSDLLFDVSNLNIRNTPDIAPPPQHTWLVSSDEAGIGGQRYYGFGSLWMSWERRGTFHGEFMDICRYHGMCNDWEVRWSNLDSGVRGRVAMDLVDWFFRRRWLMFHCVVVNVADVNWRYHDGSFDLARRRHFAMFINRKMSCCASLHPERPNRFRLWIDAIEAPYIQFGGVTKLIAGRTLKQELNSRRADIDSVQERDSKVTPSIQLCNLLLGAVIDAWQRQSKEPQKLTLAAEVARHLGWPDLRADTFPSERKFNVWYFRDRSRDRSVRSRPVNLLHPLPSRRGSP